MLIFLLCIFPCGDNPWTVLFHTNISMTTSMKPCSPHLYLFQISYSGPNGKAPQPATELMIALYSVQQTAAATWTYFLNDKSLEAIQSTNGKSTSERLAAWALETEKSKWNFIKPVESHQTCLLFHPCWIGKWNSSSNVALKSSTRPKEVPHSDKPPW